jgi:periplasmic divalent cation tolerance protein
MGPIMQESPDIRLVFTTVESRDQAAELAQQLVTRRLAACVTCLTGQSYFRWEGDEVSEQSEILLLIKTHSGMLAELERYFANAHPYSCPELIVLKTDQLGDSYGNWLTKELSR